MLYRMMQAPQNMSNALTILIVHLKLSGIPVLPRGILPFMGTADKNNKPAVPAKLAVFSDSHGDDAVMADILALERPHAVLHLGDCCADTAVIARRYPQLPLYRVRGNNDYTDEAPMERLLTFAGVRIYMAHGHRYRVKMGCSALAYRALECGAQIAVFGHTHQPLLERERGLWLLNPGSVCRFFYNTTPTYGVITLNGEIRCDIRTWEKGYP